MKKITATILGVLLAIPLFSQAQNEMSHVLFNQLKQKIENSCTNDNYLKCVEMNQDSCQQVSQHQLAAISDLIDANSQAIAAGEIKELLKAIKTSRTNVFEQSGIEVEKANACGKEFLTS